MNQNNFAQIFSDQELEKMFPPERSHDFFEAFYGSSEDSHFDIRLGFEGASNSRLNFCFELVQRPGGCLACNMTFGLPHVLARHPVINVKGIVQAVGDRLDVEAARLKWTLGNTLTHSSKIHKIPLIISIE